ncbi:Ku70 [Cynara cardunculus var. scolymus]|uniref:ATP-dependent DNA helicase 2 subunit KU70 n=1 Tax=Cynara cardunculus var. scolymus TaxID=59895 RepID=A0A118JSY8_CYNCS|nr:Ku70 [Cynara cardunculus var. scolymus]
MDMDPDDVFRDEEDDPENDLYQERQASKELLVYLVDASPKMFNITCPGEDQKNESHFHVAVSCIAQFIKVQIINRPYDEIAICFFNTREKKNLQDLNGVYVFNVAEREHLDNLTARFIREFDCVEESFNKLIGSEYGIVSGSRDNSLYNAFWVAQALLRKGSAKTADKRILLLTNEDDPFGNIKGVTKLDMARTTLQRAKDAQDLGISIELLPLSRPNEEFNVSLCYADLIGLDGDDLAQFMPLAGERSFICADTGALVQEPPKRFQIYKNEEIKFSTEELSEIKRVSTGSLRLLGFKPLSCLKDYHNLRPSTFVSPSDEEVMGSTCIFIALHRSMIRLKRFAVAFYGSSARPQLVGLVAQDEIVDAGGQLEPPGMHMIYLPYSEDIRLIEELHSETTGNMPSATEDQIQKATALMKRVDLRDFSVCQFANPALQSHYAVVQALALDEDEMPEINDETLPDEEGMARPGIAKALEEFKVSVYGENYDEENENTAQGKANAASKKRKVASEDALVKCAYYDWPKLADDGKLKDLTVQELKYYVTAHKLPVAGKKEALISRILTHMGK